MTTDYHDGFMLALVLSLVLLIPALFLTNKKAIGLIIIGYI